MQDRFFTLDYFIAGTTAANHLIYCELPYPWALMGVKACAVNDSDATLAVGGGATIAAAVIGDGDPAYLQPTTVPAQIAANTLVTLTLDYDGSGGTAAQQVSISVIGFIGSG